MQEVHIEYLTEKNINKKKWDHCISNATNGLIYGYSYYLDYMADHWDALVLNDYHGERNITYTICTNRFLLRNQVYSGMI